MRGISPHGFFCGLGGEGERPVGPVMAEGEGFEPPVPCGTPVFKTGSLNHSDTPPST